MLPLSFIQLTYVTCNCNSTKRTFKEYCKIRVSYEQFVQLPTIKTTSFEQWSPFGLLHRVVIKRSDASEERSASTFRVTKLVQVDVQVLGWKKIWRLHHYFSIRLKQLSPWRWRQYVPTKRRNISSLHGAKTQKTTIICPTTAMKSWKHITGSVLKVPELSVK